MTRLAFVRFSAQRYWPAYFSTLAMLSFVTKPGPDRMWRAP